jgi:hypothetical protein
VNDLRARAMTALAAELDSGERLLWSEPMGCLGAARRAAPVAGFGAAWVAFAVFLFSILPDSAGRIRYVVLVFEWAFAAVGVALLTAPLVAAYRACATVYAVTSKRALTLRSEALFISKYVEVFFPASIVGLRRVAKKNGTHDVYFARRVTREEGVSQVEDVGFYGVVRVEELERVLRELSEPQSTPYR